MFIVYFLKAIKNYCLYLVPPTFKCTISLSPKEGGTAIIISDSNADFHFDNTLYSIILILIKQLENHSLLSIG